MKNALKNKRINLPDCIKNSCFVLKRKVFTLFMAVFILFNIFTPNLLSVVLAADYSWNGSIANSFRTGDGSESDPYQIVTAEQFALLMNGVNGTNGLNASNFSSKCYKLMRDINLNGDKWQSIGTKDNPFKGKFDGNEKKVNNFKIESSEENGQGLFGYVSSTAEIKNLTVESADVSGKYYVGIIAGHNNGTINSCEVKGKTNANGYEQIGGVVGRNENNGKLVNCTSYASIFAINGAVGGIVGENHGQVVNCSYSLIKNETKIISGDSNENKNYGDDVGGICGWNEGGTIQQCVNNVSIELKSKILNIPKSEQVDTGRENVGGICGTNKGDILACENNADVKGDINVAGVCGKNEGSLIDVLNSGDVDAYNNAGGICGFNYNGEITCKNSKTFSTDKSIKNFGWLAGIWDAASKYNNQKCIDTGNNNTMPACGYIVSLTGSGTKDEPYEISNITSLNQLASSVNSGITFSNQCFKVTNDITLPDNFAKIGNNDYSFCGIFDGDGKTITLGNNKTLFGAIGQRGKVYNLKIEVNKDLNINDSNSNCGLLANYSQGTIQKCETKSNSYAFISVPENVLANFGAVVGLNSGTVEECSNNVLIAVIGAKSGSPLTNVGGIVGKCDRGNVKYCKNSEVISMVPNIHENTSIGGIVGFADKNVKIVGCENEGSIIECTGFEGGATSGVDTYVEAKNANSSIDNEKIKTKKYGGICGSLNDISSELSSCIDKAGNSVVGYFAGYIRTSYVKGINTNLYIESPDDKDNITTSEETKKRIINCKGLDDTELSNINPASTKTSIVLPNTFASGSGKKSDPYILSSAEHFKNLRDLVEAGNSFEDVYFKITNSVTLGSQDESWKPIGTLENSFNGHIYAASDSNNHNENGDNKPCKNTDENIEITVNINTPKENNVGLFGVIERKASIEHININGNIVGDNNVGSVVGYNRDGKIFDCVSNANVSGNNSIGGIVGKMGDPDADVSCEIYGCTNKGNVNGKECIGGICGEIERLKAATSEKRSTITTCVNEGNVTGTADYIGGIVGYNTCGKVELCTNLGTIQGFDSLGGIAGYAVGLSLKMPGSSGFVFLEAEFDECTNGKENANPVMGKIISTNGRFGGKLYEYVKEIVGNPASFGKGDSKVDVKIIENNIKRYGEIIYKEDDDQLIDNTGINSSTNFASGNGLKDSPYEIGSVQELQYLAEQVKNGNNYKDCYFKLTADIDYLEYSNFKAIGTIQHPFRGIFNGDNHIINNLILDNTSGNYQGLFGVLGEGGVVRNIILENAAIKGGLTVGAVCGLNNGGTLYGCTVKDSTIIAKKESTEEIQSHMVGGLCGYNKGEVKYCESIVDLSSANIGKSGYYHMGVICGGNSENGKITNCRGRLATQNPSWLKDSLNNASKHFFGLVSGVNKNSNATDVKNFMFRTESIGEDSYDIGTGVKSTAFRTTKSESAYEKWNSWKKIEPNYLLKDEVNSSKTSEDISDNELIRISSSDSDEEKVRLSYTGKKDEIKTTTKTMFLNENTKIDKSITKNFAKYKKDGKTVEIKIAIKSTENKMGCLSSISGGLPALSSLFSSSTSHALLPPPPPPMLSPIKNFTRTDITTYDNHVGYRIESIYTGMSSDDDKFDIKEENLKSEANPFGVLTETVKYYNGNDEVTKEEFLQAVTDLDEDKKSEINVVTPEEIKDGFTTTYDSRTGVMVVDAKKTTLKVETLSDSPEGSTYTVLGTVDNDDKVLGSYKVTLCDYNGREIITPEDSEASNFLTLRLPLPNSFKGQTVKIKKILPNENVDEIEADVVTINGQAYAQITGNVESGNGTPIKGEFTLESNNDSSVNCLKYCDIPISSIETSAEYYVVSNLKTAFKKLDLTKAEVDVDISAPSNEFNYTGQPIEPDITIKSGDQELVKNKDYVLEYENNTYQGEAKVLVKFIGDYTGEKQTSFVIKGQSSPTIPDPEDPKPDNVEDIIKTLIEGQDEIDLNTAKKILDLYNSLDDVSKSKLSEEILLKLKEIENLLNSTPSLVYADDKTGTIINAPEGVFKIGSILVVEFLKNGDSIYDEMIKQYEEFLKSQRNFKLMDIYVKDLDGVKYKDLSGFVRVSVKVPDDFESDNLQIVYLGDNGNIEYFDTNVEITDGIKYAVFETNHFSCFALIEKSQNEINNNLSDNIDNIENIKDLKTGDKDLSFVLVLLNISFLSMSIIIILRKKRVI